MKEVQARPLVLRNAYDNEGASHPFRRSLPFELLKHIEEQVAAEQVAVEPKKWLNEDVSLFILSFSAFFTAFSLFIF